MAATFPFIENEFDGKRARVTGATAGIGQAIVSRLLLTIRELVADSYLLGPIWYVGSCSESMYLSLVTRDILED